MLRKLAASLVLVAGVAMAHAAPEVVPLGVTVNGERGEDIFGWQTEDGLWLPESALLRWGLKVKPTATFQGKPAVPLRSVADKVLFDESEFRLTVTLTAQEIAKRTKVSLLSRQAQDITVTPGLVMDYEFAAGRFWDATSLSGRVRSHASLASWQLLDERVVHSYEGKVHSGLWRTTLRKDWLAQNLRLDAGTLTTPDSGLLGYWPDWRGVSLSSVHFGHNSLQASRSSASLSAPVLLPSTADIYVNGVKQATYAVAPGMFDVHGLRGYAGGAAQVKAVIRDVFGRETVLEEARYVGDTTLAAGAHEFSYQLGRQAYEPDGSAQLRGAHRFGLSPNWTLTGRLQVGKDVRMVQAGAVTQFVGVGELGLNALVGRDKAGEGRRGFSLTHDYRAGNWSVASALSSRPAPAFNGKAFVTMDVRELATQASMASDWGQFQVRAAGAQFEDGKRSRELEVGWSKNLTMQLLAHVSLRRNTMTGSAAHLLLVWRPREGYNINSFSSTAKGEFSQQLTVSKEPGAGPTLWRLDVQGASDYRAATATVDHDLGIGVAQASVHNSGGASSGRVAFRGGLMASALGVSMTTGRSDAGVLVDTSGLAGVGVFRNGTQVGSTDQRGHLWVSDVKGYEEVRLTLNESDIPMDHWYAGAAVKPVRPSPGSVVPVRFDIRGIRSTSVTVLDCTASCVVAPDLLLVLESEGGVRTHAAVKAGKAWLDGLLTGKHSVTSADQRCAGELDVPRTGDLTMQLKCSAEGPKGAQ